MRWLGAELERALARFEVLDPRATSQLARLGCELGLKPAQKDRVLLGFGVAVLEVAVACTGHRCQRFL